ncbi:MAG: ribonuclease H-like domain-containing protein [Chloroflexota bacterium]|nr:MAG: ribonuclease H-like domain-containing protein [Chloroflexota bacterium]
MSSLAEKLKALGVNIGPDGVKPSTKSPKYPIERVVEGREVVTPYGEAFLVENQYTVDPRDEKQTFEFSASLTNLSSWIRDPELVNLASESFLFLDTETSGLAGGAGTFAFLIGIGRYSTGGFHLSQYFMRDPFEEPAQLAAVLGALSDAAVLVTYNGKTFDVPLLNSRFILNGEFSPLNSYAHIDLLHLARRLWRDRLESRTLGSIEENILGLRRTEEDIPGWMVPTIYFDYIKTGDARPLTKVLYHNAMDILSLATLLNHISLMLDDPHGGLVDHGVDLISMGRVFEDIGDLDSAAKCYAKGLNFDLPSNIQRKAIYQWSFMEKRRENLEISIELWQQATELDEIYAFEELAKAFEHKFKDFSQAIHWTELAIKVINSTTTNQLNRAIWHPKFKHRLDRLFRKSHL